MPTHKVFNLFLVNVIVLSDIQALAGGKMGGIDNEKRGPGKPTKYFPGYCKEVITMGLRGYSVVQMASAFGVARSTLIGWRAQHEDFDAAVELALTHAQAAWEKIGFESLHRKDFQGASYVKLMQARFRADYTERAEISGPDGGPIARVTHIELVAKDFPPDHPSRLEGETRRAPCMIDVPSTAVKAPDLTEFAAADACANVKNEPEATRSDAELLRLYDDDPDITDELSGEERDNLTRAIVHEAEEKRLAAEQAERIRVAEQTQRRLHLPPNIGARKRAFK